MKSVGRHVALRAGAPHRPVPPIAPGFVARVNASGGRAFRKRWRWAAGTAGWMGSRCREQACVPPPVGDPARARGSGQADLVP
ncbi:ATP-NAD/AcoX kinase [Cereibacter sphaeroides KD131]|nr:ATP-NAD/AcoX kinase [Cereibacter sphaeroides KD131]